VTPDLKTKAKDDLQHLVRPTEAPVVLAVGRLTPEGLALDPRLCSGAESRPARLLILVEERPALEALARRLGLEQDVSLPGFVANPYPYMAQASLFVLSSRWEGLPTVLIEALSCGTPLISTDCPSGPREILSDGRFGKLVPVGNVPALAHAMESMLNRTTPRPPRESWQPYALETVVNQYVSILLGE
jgi:glycosyltransferase involved in cell wall biosynthesis